MKRAGSQVMRSFLEYSVLRRNTLCLDHIHTKPPGRSAETFLISSSRNFPSSSSSSLLTLSPSNYRILLSSDSTFKHKQATILLKLLHQARPFLIHSAAPPQGTVRIFTAVPKLAKSIQNRVTTNNTRLSMYSCSNAYRNHPPLTLQPFPIPRKPCSLYARSNG